MYGWRSIVNGSRPVPRVYQGETGTLVPVSRDHFAIGNERARTVCDRSTSSCERSTYVLSRASLTYFRDMCNCHTGHSRICHPQLAIPICRRILPQIICSWYIPQTHVVLRSSKQNNPQTNVRRRLLCSRTKRRQIFFSS